MENTWTYVAIFIALYYVVTKTIRKKHANLPPSPFPSLPILGHIHLFRDSIHRTLAKFAARHGPILLLRLGRRRILLLSTYSAAEQCIGKNAVVFANRPVLLGGEIFGYNYTSITFAPYGDHWRNLRQYFINEIISPHRLNLQAGIRADEVKLLLRRIYHHISSSPSDGSGSGLVNVRSMTLEAVNNVMTRMIAGKRYFGECEETEEAKRFRDILPVFVEKFGELTTISDFFPALRWFTAGHEKKFRSAMKDVDEFVQVLVDQQRKKMEAGEGCDRDGKSDYSMLELLLSQQKTDPEVYNDDIVKGLLLVLIQAGTDNSAVSVEWALTLLLNNPTTLKKAQKEIDEVVGHHRLIEESDLKNLTYLRCIIKEMLRMYPIAPYFMRNASKDCEVKNVGVGGGHYQIPRDTNVIVNVWAIQNDPNVWDEPRKFMPERFYEETLMNKGPNNNYLLMPFGVGRRVCPGEDMSVRMIALILGSLLQCFEWERTVGDEDVDKMQESLGLNLHRTNPLIAKCTPRRQNMIDLFLA